MKKNFLVSVIALSFLAVTACGTSKDAGADTSQSENAPNEESATSEEDSQNSDQAVSEEDGDDASLDETGDISEEETDEETSDDELSEDEIFYTIEGEEITADEDGKLSCSLFNITMPSETEGTYYAYATDNSISIYEKGAKDKNYGGFAFSVLAYENPSDYAGGMDMKVGEMTLSDGTVYDVVRSYPSDVQWDFSEATEVDGEIQMPEAYARLYDGADGIIETLEPADGGSFGFMQGVKGEDLYGDVLSQIKTAIEEEWDANKLEENNLSSMYCTPGIDAINVIGYAYYDTNNDGIDELLVGEIADGDYKGTVYDIFTMVDREPQHVVSGWDRSRYYALEYGMIVNEYSSGAGESGQTTYDIVPNSTELYAQRALKYDEYTDPENPWFVSYDLESDEWESISEEDYNWFDPTDEYVRFDFTPMSEVE